MKKVDNDPDIFNQPKCGVCKKRVATRLCDFVVEYRRPMFFRDYYDFTEQQRHGTCNFPMCDECSKKHNEIYDFCPHHAKAFEQCKPTDEMKRASYEYEGYLLKKSMEGNK